MKWSRGLLVWLLAAAPLAADSISLDVSVREHRGHSSSTGGLEIQFTIADPSVADAKGYRVRWESAVDDTGRVLLDEATALRGALFSRPFKPAFGKVSCLLFTKPAAREAQTVAELRGTIEFSLPQLDPAAAAVISVEQIPWGTPLAHPVLAAAGIDITFHNLATHDAQKIPGKLPANSVGWQTTRGRESVVSIEVTDAAGAPLPRAGNGWAGPDIGYLSFREAPPADARVVVSISTARSIVSVPFHFTRVPLP